MMLHGNISGTSCLPLFKCFQNKQWLMTCVWYDLPLGHVRLINEREISCIVQELQELVTQEQNVILQTSNALNKCCSADSQFVGSAEQVECNRLLLVSCMCTVSLIVASFFYNSSSSWQIFKNFLQLSISQLLPCDFFYIVIGLLFYILNLSHIQKFRWAEIPGWQKCQKMVGCGTLILWNFREIPFLLQFSFTAGVMLHTFNHSEYIMSLKRKEMYTYHSGATGIFKDINQNWDSAEQLFIGWNCSFLL